MQVTQRFYAGLCDQKTSAWWIQGFHYLVIMRSPCHFLHGSKGWTSPVSGTVCFRGQKDDLLEIHNRRHFAASGWGKWRGFCFVSRMVKVKWGLRPEIALITLSLDMCFIQLLGGCIDEVPAQSVPPTLLQMRLACFIFIFSLFATIGIHRNHPSPIFTSCSDFRCFRFVGDGAAERVLLAVQQAQLQTKDRAK